MQEEDTEFESPDVVFGRPDWSMIEDIFALSNVVKEDQYWRCRDGAVIKIADMNPEHLDNAVAYVRRQLREVDDSIRDIAVGLSGAPERAEELVPQLGEMTKRQLSHEKTIRRLMSEETRRKRQVDRKRSVRGVVIQTEAVQPKDEGLGIKAEA